jgi:hypothetical protein
LHLITNSSFFHYTNPLSGKGEKADYNQKNHLQSIAINGDQKQSKHWESLAIFDDLWQFLTINNNQGQSNR